MKLVHTAFWLVAVSAILALPAASAVGEDGSPTAQTDVTAHVTLEAPDWQAVLDRLFGTPDSGLLDGSKSFSFRAEGLTLTAAQSADFFTSTASPSNVAALVETVQTLHGTIRLEGTIDGQPFEFKVAGRELKLEGLTLTSDQLQALVAELKTAGLHEMKIEALVDGKETVMKVERNHQKLEVLGHRHDGDDDLRFTDRGRREHPEKIEIEHSLKPERVERIDHIERLEKPERLESGRH